MPTRTGDEVKAGVMVVVSLALLGVLMAAVGPCRSLFRNRYDIHVLFKDVGGLKPNSPVRYSGVEIGRVKSIKIVYLNEANIARLPALSREQVYELPVGDGETEDSLYDIDDPDQRNRAITKALRGRTMVELTLEVFQTGQFQECRVDAIIRIDSTLMGDTAIEISPGSGTFCQPGKVLIGDSGSLFSDLRDSVDDIRRMMRRAGSAMGDVDQADIGKAVKSIVKGAERFSGVIDDIAETTKGAREIVQGNKDDIRAAVKDIRAAAGEAKNILGDARPKLARILDGTQVITKAVNDTMGSVHKKVEALLDSAQRAAVATENLMGDIRPQMREVMTEATNALRRASVAAEEARTLIGDARPDVRRSMLNIKGATRNVEEMTSMLARKPWLVLRPSRQGDTDLAKLYTSTRHLHDSTARLADAVERLGGSAAAGRLSAADAKRLRELLTDVRDTAGTIESARESIEVRIDKLRIPSRKAGGRRFEKSRNSKSEYPRLDRMRKD